MIIKNLRLENGWSQEQLADITGLSTRTIQRIEKDDEVSLESLKLLANAFKIDIKNLQELLNNKGKPMPIREKIEKNTGVITFIGVNLLLFIINILTNPHHLWFIYPLFGWGITLYFRRYKRQLKQN
ncbi:helix-turn-helix domain-containing protein [Sulfurospirillum oryzae]|uniref:helix-turn-helix domain-containing protein n=1 Tax=Sulfurospirillum oryzae TaxID=2976535 RepID=UPI0021E7C532|nr:helix-turn-helix domain-containing protein [Sulfurospirillum oryzae]